LRICDPDKPEKDMLVNFTLDETNRIRDFLTIVKPLFTE